MTSCQFEIDNEHFILSVLGPSYGTHITPRSEQRLLKKQQRVEFEQPYPDSSRFGVNRHDIDIYKQGGTDNFAAGNRLAFRGRAAANARAAIAIR
jgi:hypothetical protein